MTREQWEPKSAKTTVEFIRKEGFPQGLMEVKTGAMVLKDQVFGNGTIDVDVRIADDGAPGIRFRQSDEDTAEELYIRPGVDCPASQDCMQYAPRIHGALLWDTYPQYQSAAPISVNGWNHLRIVASGRRLNVYVNGLMSPSLSVGRLESDSQSGGIQVRGPAVFANFKIAPGVVDGLRREPADDPTAKDGRYLRTWKVSAFFELPGGEMPQYSLIPLGSAAWAPIAAERNGLINLSRRYKTPDPGQRRIVAWLKTTVDSRKEMNKVASMGWLREAWVFVNGQEVFAGRNFWDPPGPKRKPDGRLSLDNARITLPLRKGANEIAIAVSNEESDSASHFGWGIELRLDDREGVSQTP